jgi:hypothetical protein
VGDRSDVLDADHLDTGVLDGTNRGLAPGPFTMTSTLRTPCSIARRATVSAASCAANGVLLRDPLNPTLPDEAQASVLPCWSVIVMIVLLNEDLM